MSIIYKETFAPRRSEVRFPSALLQNTLFAG